MQLSLVRPDFSSIRTQLEATLSNYSAWRDTLPTGTGRTLTDWIAAVGANDQYAIEHAFRESFRTARLDSSIFAQALLLGVRLMRKRPCYTRVSLQKVTTDTITIPAYTQFSTTGSALFNRTAITLIGTTPVEVLLYEGVPYTKSVIGDGTAYQMYVSDDADFTVSESDVNVKLNDVTLPRTTRGLWKLADSQGYSDSTTATGQLLVTFGGDGYGSTPQTSDRIELTYVTTKGSFGQNAALTGANIVCNGYKEVSGVALTGLSGGADEKEPIFYRKLGPQLFAARDGATTEEEYSAVAARYGGVIDAKVLGQRNIAPADARWMNMVQVSLLTQRPWSGADWDEFDDWFRKRSMYPVRLFRKDPVPVVVDISVRVFCQGRADLALVKAGIVRQIEKLFAPRPGLIDNNIYLSDIHGAIKDSDSTIEYADILTPSTDVLVSVKPPSPLTLTALSGGTLAAGQYSVAVTAVTDLGETLATNFTSVVVGANGAVKIDWPEVPQATSYNIYGRTPLNLGRIGTVPAGTLTFTDTGAVTPVTGLPLINGAGHRYPKLGTLTVETQYTNRNFYNLGSLR